MYRLSICMLLLVSAPVPGLMQVTTGALSGLVKSRNGERMSGATVKIIHEPTATVFFTQTSRQGIYAIENLNPGGPYLVEVSFPGFTTASQTGFHIQLGEKAEADFVLEPHIIQLQQVTVSTTKKRWPEWKPQKIISADKIEAFPSISRNLEDYLMAIPQAKTVGETEGAISFAGQNNRYNAFSIDGTVNNDVFGLAASGTNGGQAGISPLSTDAIEQLQVSISPYDASIGNFTGAAIHAVTRAGTNRRHTSLYHYFSNRLLRGNIPVANDSLQPVKPDFFRRIYGFRTQGPIIKNRLFYFVNMEIQREKYTQPYLLNHYQGNTNDPKQILILYNSLISSYGYDAGSFTEMPGLVFADRLVARFDWNLNTRHNITAGFRYMNGQRINSNPGNASTLYFGNSGFALFTHTISGSVEWKSRIGRKMGNRLLVTYTNVKDDRAPHGQPFPRVRIYDGDGSIVLGTDNSSAVNLLVQHNWVLANKWYGSFGKHSWAIGIDASGHHIYNAFIQNAFGNYTYASIGDFLRRMPPSGYQLGFSIADSIPGDIVHAAARISVLRGAFFVNDEYRITTGLTLQAGLRADMHFFLSPPIANKHVNDTALPAFAQYYEIEGARSGAAIQIPLTISPRLGFVYTFPVGNTVLRGGIGIFTGRMPIAWPGGVYQLNGTFTGGYQAAGTQLSRIRFKPDAYRQWRPSELGTITNKDPLNLVAGKLYMPSLARASLSIEKILRKSWTFSAEIILSKNLQEIAYTNINLLPPTLQIAGPDRRLVYTDSNQSRIPLHADGGNPYGYAILLSNRKNDKGHAISISAGLKKQIDNVSVECNYNYGKSTTVQDATSSVNLSQWRMAESVNGRNKLQKAESDFSSGHRVFIWVTEKFRFNRRKSATTLSIVYNGQSGSGYSYVYGGSSLVRDDGKASGYELLYVPTASELQAMNFLPIIVANTVFTTEQQKMALEEFIGSDRYLIKRRGQYAEKNANRTPFTHIVDIKSMTDVPLKINKLKFRIQILFDLLNVGNLLSRDWGRRYFQPFDKIELVEFAGYTGNLQPQYRFNPLLIPAVGKPVSTNPSPLYAAFWSCQMGIRFNF